ncbi:hypothetical protein C1646_680886 [Rhizophagus diaphanus]|nr:hypothetical protein C1646_680886 [Rhizophagus diaphanus] [Rhizophagus sp. MUCL 43196]
MSVIVRKLFIVYKWRMLLLYLQVPKFVLVITQFCARRINKKILLFSFFVFEL